MSPAFAMQTQRWCAGAEVNACSLTGVSAKPSLCNCGDAGQDVQDVSEGLYGGLAHGAAPVRGRALGDA